MNTPRRIAEGALLLTMVALAAVVLIHRPAATAAVATATSTTSVPAPAAPQGPHCGSSSGPAGWTVTAVQSAGGCSFSYTPPAAVAAAYAAKVKAIALGCTDQRGVVIPACVAARSVNPAAQSVTPKAQPVTAKAVAAPNYGTCTQALGSAGNYSYPNTAAGCGGHVVAYQCVNHMTLYASDRAWAWAGGVIHTAATDGAEFSGTWQMTLSRCQTGH